MPPLDTLAFAVVAATVVSDTGTNPHSAVRLLMRASPRSVMVNTLRKPATFTAVLATGCAPPERDYSDVVAVHGMHGATTGSFNRGYTAWIARAEDELADVCSLDGRARSRATGRALGPKFVLQPALGPIGTEATRVLPTTVAWQVLAAWLGQLQQALCAQRVLLSRASPEPWTRCHPDCTVARVRARLLRHDWTHLGDCALATEFKKWLAAIDGQLLCDIPYVVSIRVATVKRAHSLAAHDLAERRKSWISWLHGGPSAGLGRQHRMTRVAHGWISTPVAAGIVEIDPECRDGADDVFELDRADPDGGCLVQPLHCQQAVDAEAAKWATVWRVGTLEPGPAWPELLGESLPPLCVNAFVCACESLVPSTGLGWDQIHPRALLRFSRGAIIALLRILILCEILGEWPLAMGVVIIAMLPRTDGGLRPIGLCPGIIRVWMALRMPVARAWQTSHERPFFFAGVAKGADVATWKQAARAELAASSRAEYAIVLLDLVKCFDTVPHDWLVRQAIALGYNLWLLRLSIAVYRMRRAMRIGLCYSKTMLACCGITAGAVMATIELRVLLIMFLDYAAAINPLTYLTIYVDDMSIEAAGPAGSVRAALVPVLAYLASCVTLLRMEHSPTKNFCCASHIRIGRAIVEALPQLLLSFARRVTSLGAPLAAGRRRSALVAVKRLKAFRLRVKRFRALRRVGVNTAKLIRTGGSAALTYGQHVCGVSNAMLLQQRRSVASCTVLSRGGGDLDITLLLADGCGTGRADPAFDAHLAPIGHWAMAIWENWSPRPLLQRLVVRAKLRMSVAKSQWANVHGPAAAYVASALRLQWVIHDALRVTMDNGVGLNFSVDSPAFVKRAICQSVRRWRWRAIGIRVEGADPDGCGDGSFLLPIYRLLDPRYNRGDTSWGSAQRAGLRSAMADRQWTQDRLHAANLAPSPECQLCWAAAKWDTERGCRTCRHPVARGTKGHRLWECPVTEPWRIQVAPPVLLRRRECAKQAGQLNTATWTRGLWPLQAQSVPKPPEEATFSWVKRPHDDCVDGILYTDGSLIDGLPDYGGLCGRLGWSFVAVNRQGRITASAHGSPPAWITTVYGAEVWALMMAASYALPGTAFRTDCQAALRVFLRGSAFATAGQSYYARVWASLFAALDDQGADTDILWMPAHTGPDRLGIAKLSDGSLMTRTDQMANDLADELAKAAARQYRVPEVIRSRIAADQILARQLAMWVGQATAMANACPTTDGKTVRDSCPAPRASKTDVPNPPMVSRARPPPVAPAARWAAKLRAAIIVDEFVSHVSHRVRLTGSVTWCGRCGAYASMRGRGMAKPCRGAPSVVATARWALTRLRPAAPRPRATRISRSRASQIAGCPASGRCKRAVRGAALRLFALRSGFHPVTGMPLLSPLHTGSAPLPAACARSGITTPAAERLAAMRARVRAREHGQQSGGTLHGACCRVSAAGANEPPSPCSGSKRRLVGVVALDRLAALRARVAAKEAARLG